VSGHEDNYKTRGKGTTHVRRLVYHYMFDFYSAY